MSGSDKQPRIDRRQFLKGAAAAGPALAAASLVSPQAAQAAQTPAGAAAPATMAVREQHPPGTGQPLAPGYVVGGDHMTDCLRALDIEYVASCPGSTFRGFQESIINYGGNKKPEFLTALHEDSSVHFAMGYAKITGKPRLQE